VTLRVVIDGVALAEAEARAFWDRFSLYMDEHPRDLAGFAKTEGLASVSPEMGAGGAVLVGSRTAAQKPYANARASSGSPDHQRGGGGGALGAKSSKKSR
jgi:hypothetical protein